jgi:hypothetical protein
MKIYILKKSNVKGKRMSVISEGKKIDFGSNIGKTYIDHNDDKKKDAWIKRHKSGNPDKFDDINSPLFWANVILWNRKSIDESIRDIQKKYKIRVLSQI